MIYARLDIYPVWKLDPLGGATIDNVAETAVRFCRENACCVQFTFNDIELTVFPESKPHWVVGEYHRKRNKD